MIPRFFRDTRFPSNLFDELVYFLFVGFRQTVFVLVQYRLQFGSDGNNDVVAGFLLFQVYNQAPLSSVRMLPSLIVE